MFLFFRNKIVLHPYPYFNLAKCSASLTDFVFFTPLVIFLQFSCYPFFSHFGFSFNSFVILPPFIFLFPDGCSPSLDHLFLHSSDVNFFSLLIHILLHPILILYFCFAISFASYTIFSLVILSFHVVSYPVIFCVPFNLDFSLIIASFNSIALHPPSSFRVLIGLLLFRNSCFFFFYQPF